MAKIVVTKRVDAPIDEVWASWDDFGNIYKFNPGVSASRLLTDESAPTRVGTRRQCDFSDNKNWVREEVIAYEPGKSILIDVYDGTLPLKSMVATIDFEIISESRTRIRFTAEFEPKFGLVGKLMVPLMKRQFGAILKDLLNENAVYVGGSQPVAVAA